MIEYVALNHPRFARAQRAIFTSRVTPDCLNHGCRLVNQHDQLKLDACCQYGVDVDVAERDGILRHADEISALLCDGAAAQPWFQGRETEDVDFPSGRFVRTATYGQDSGTRDSGGGCIFLAHDRRGCAIHRASIAAGWDFRGIKPHVCRLFPLSYESDAIVLSDDYGDYSCSLDAGAPSVYRVVRDTIGEIFGTELVAALDRAEREVLGPRSLLRVIAAS